MNRDRPVIVAMDLGKHGDRIALTEGYAAARRAGCRLILVHVLRPKTLCARLFPKHNAEQGLEEAGQRIAAIDTLRHLVDELPRESKVEIELEIRDGSVTSQLIDLTEHARAQLLVIGCAAHEVGGTTATVLQCAPCPVLVARASPAEGPVVAATDLSDPSTPAITAAAAMARVSKLELHAIHVIEPWIDPRIRLEQTGVAVPYMVSDQVAAMAGHLRRHLEKLGTRAKMHTPVGLPATTIARIARETECRLLVIGTSVRCRPWRFFAGSLAKDIVRRAPCSVLVTRLNRHTVPAAEHPLTGAAGR